MSGPPHPRTQPTGIASCIRMEVSQAPAIVFTTAVLNPIGNSERVDRTFGQSMALISPRRSGNHSRRRDEKVEERGRGKHQREEFRRSTSGSWAWADEAPNPTEEAGSEILPPANRQSGPSPRPLYSLQTREQHARGFQQEGANATIED